MTADEMRAALAERSDADSPLARRMELGKALLDALPALLERHQRVQDAIWPGLPVWAPTPESPQQNFFEAVAEALRKGAAEAEQYRQVVQEGKRLPAPELSQDPAFAAFVLAGFAVLETSGAWSIHDVSERGKAEEAKSLEVATRNAELEAERDHLLAFKAYVHARLDAAGVSADPDGPHKARGCRVGGRLDEALALFALAADQSQWSQATFGTDAERGPIGALKHLAKEAAEAEAAVVMNEGPGGDRGMVAEELADCLLLTLDAARRAGFGAAELLRAAALKMAINRSRAWPKTTGDVPSEHVRG